MTKRTGSGPWKKGSTREYRRHRAAQLRRVPYCEAEGCSEPATETDHITPISQGGDMLGPMRSLCYQHHLERHRKAPRGCDADGTPNDPNHWWSAG